MIERMRLSDLVGDFVAYRNLEPPDARLRGLPAIRAELGLPAGRVPRKAEPDYAKIVAHLLRQAQSLRGLCAPLERVLYIGDTRLNDRVAAANLGRYFAVRAFIGEDRLQDAPELVPQGEFAFANRWALLDDFVRDAERRGFALDENTAVVMDVDKTLIGARGRNDRPIDQARIDAACDVARAALGDRFSAQAFRSIYDELHQATHHPFTGDNQDYVVYIALMASAGVYDWSALLADLKTKRLATFEEFVAACDGRVRDASLALQPIHSEVSGNLRRGDPTPFKSFRYREYECTVARMDALPDDTPRASLLAGEIVLTGEVVRVARELGGRGVLLMALSDKPNEASFPCADASVQGAEAATQGRLPLHRATMKVLSAESSV